MVDSKIIERTLMRQNHEVLRFRYNLVTSHVVGKVDMIDANQLPVGTYECDGTFTRPLLDAWISDRAVPFERAADVTVELGMNSSNELMLSTLGLSLSDQYWLMPTDTYINWHDVNPFENTFDTVLGQALAPENENSASRAIALIEGNPTIIYSSPDAACGGNLPKYWDIVDGERRLYKSGKVANGIMEPYNEAIATELCSRLITQDQYVPSRIEDYSPFPRVFSSCPCMIDSKTELIPAHAVMKLAAHDNSKSLYEKFASVCLDNGIDDVHASLDRMLLIDHLLSNRDRHWANFGVIRDVETNIWLGLAPLFDMGESLWCDRIQSPSLRPYKMAYSMPFRREPMSQLEAFATNLDWFVSDALEGFADVACDIASQNPFAAAAPEFLNLIHDGIEKNIEEALNIAACLHPTYFIKY